MSDTVKLTRDGPVATVTIDRPDAMNSLDTSTKIGLLDAVREVAEDEDVRAVVLTGNGRAFCVGQDLNELAIGLDHDPDQFWDTVRDHYSPVVRHLAEMPKPVVAALNGVAAGAGAAFAFACDFRIASQRAGVNLAFASIGLSADSGTTWTLPRLVGTARARSLLMRPRTLSAEECLQHGLVDEVVPPEALTQHTRDLATELAAGPTLAYAALREALLASSSSTLSEALALEERLMRSTGTTRDHRDAVTAFLGKQKPVFSGVR
jgi:2-(1,2-epoxy-1,2-dihydrophenyl)acetyl-CoA isomerase